ncbi:histone H2A deubiquitinase MYSM1 [Megalops cyprinoides]|uniref:histone H2A deubiquitinase MYSM1 n=1 Tax=Megalops cyprinoides TaxID=118141 RepID=UPI0018651A67|nr:histone H2A deubiquitinase MYSM1 [Megalops cyprinoides]
MADELDIVDIEGDETEASMRDIMPGGGIHQDQYLQSAWSTNSTILPWNLDSSISAENREVIESMLLEEQYYLAGKELPKNMWTGDKQKVKRSPVKSTGTTVRWAQEEKDLFEKGLAQFGRRWTKIAKLIGSRTVLQVKSYARQYFKNKAKSDIPVLATSAVSQNPPNGEIPGLEASSGSLAADHISVLSNAVRIERLSDDEDVDITDDLIDDAPLLSGKADSCEQGSSEELDSQGEPSQSPQSPASHVPKPSSCPSEQPHDGEAAEENVHSAWAQCDPKRGEEADHQPCNPGSPDGGSQSESEDTDGAAQTEREAQLGEELEEEEEELKAPEHEVRLDTSAITEEEKQAISEFFEGRPSKTPERYLKIRNYILDQWEKSKPKYLNKTSVRPGLKNCGDVNCIGRIHTYLELIGAINFNCEQAIYNRPRVADRSRVKEGRDALEAYQLAQRLQSMRTRKRRVRDMWGNWCDARDLEGQTFEHLSAEDLARRREESRKRQPRPSKVPRQKGSFDPFQLIPCQAFGEQKQEPFQVQVCAEALVVMDMHAHVSMGEVIGLLGGAYSEADKVLKICAAEPCNSLSTGLQCEMDPVSQTQASELLAGQGYSVVGWYHSHPAFDPNPSLRDIDTQAKYQSYFSRGGAPFIGMIISPYNPTNASPHSQTTCLVVSEEVGPTGSHKLPFRFEIQRSCEEPHWAQVLRRAEWVVHKYRLSHGSVPMDRLFRRDSHLTCLEKMLASLRRFLELLQDSVVNTFLAQIETLFLSEFIAETKSSQDDACADALVIDSLRFSAVQPLSSEEDLTAETVSTEEGSASSALTQVVEIGMGSALQPESLEAERGSTPASPEEVNRASVQSASLVQTP